MTTTSQPDPGTMFGGDLRSLAVQSDNDVEAVKKRLKEFKGIGDTGAEIFG